MSKIYDLFYSIKYNAKNYLNAPDGKAFEERVMKQLTGLGYNRILSHDLSKTYIQNIKGRILIKDEIIKNDTAYNQHYIYNPFGTQNYPDFIIFDQNLLVSIESKFTEKSATKPVWNSGLPRLNGLYIFGSYGKQDITFFRGIDVISHVERKKFQQFFAEEKERADLFNSQNMSNQEFGFAAYVRTAYEQKKMYNQQAVINFFDNAKRDSMEDAVLTYLQGI